MADSGGRCAVRLGSGSAGPASARPLLRGGAARALRREAELRAGGSRGAGRRKGARALPRGEDTERAVSRQT